MVHCYCLCSTRSHSGTINYRGISAYFHNDVKEILPVKDRQEAEKRKRKDKVKKVDREVMEMTHKSHSAGTGVNSGEFSVELLRTRVSQVINDLALCRQVSTF